MHSEGWKLRGEYGEIIVMSNRSYTLIVLTGKLDKNLEEDIIKYVAKNIPDLKLQDKTKDEYVVLDETNVHGYIQAMAFLGIHLI